MVVSEDMQKLDRILEIKVGLGSTLFAIEKITVLAYLVECAPHDAQ